MRVFRKNENRVNAMQFQRHQSENQLYKCIMKRHQVYNKEFSDKFKQLRKTNRPTKMVKAPQPEKGTVKLIDRVTSTFPLSDQRKLTRNRSHFVRQAKTQQAVKEEKQDLLGTHDQFKFMEESTPLTFTPSVCTTGMQSVQDCKHQALTDEQKVRIEA